MVDSGLLVIKLFVGLILCLFWWLFWLICCCFLFEFGCCGVGTCGGWWCLIYIIVWLIGLLSVGVFVYLIWCGVCVWLFWLFGLCLFSVCCNCYFCLLVCLLVVCVCFAFRFDFGLVCVGVVSCLPLLSSWHGLFADCWLLLWFDSY